MGRWGQPSKFKYFPVRISLIRTGSFKHRSGFDLGAAFGGETIASLSNRAKLWLRCVSVAGGVPRSCSQRRFVPKELPQPACG